MGMEEGSTAPCIPPRVTRVIAPRRPGAYDVASSILHTPDGTNLRDCRQNHVARHDRDR